MNNKNNTHNKWDGVDRRKGNDLLIKSINIFTILGWIVFLAVLIVSDYGRPETSKFQIAMLHLQLRSCWLPHAKEWLFILLGTCSAISITSLLANQLRMKRHSDNFRFSLFFLLAISLSITLAILL